MIFGIDLGSWTEPLFLISSLLAIAAGVLGFALEHRTPEGKLTRAGKALGIVVVVAGLTALALGLADRKIADEKEQEGDRQRNRQFESQMRELNRVTGRLDGMTRSLTQLEGNMRESLGAQRELFGVADQNLRASTALQAETQANTIRVLRRVFDESNRIAPDRIAVLASFNCPLTPLGVSGSDPYRVTLMVTDGQGRQTAFSTHENVRVATGTMFHGFLGHLGPLESFSAWADARISIVVDAHRPGGMVSLDAFTSMSREEFDAWERNLGATHICPGTSTLMLNGRQVLSATSTLRERDDRSFGASFMNLRVERSRLPRF